MRIKQDLKRLFTKNNSMKEKIPKGEYVGTGIAIGIGAGVGIGVAIKNLPAGIAMGVAIGIVLGNYIEQQQHKKHGKPTKEGIRNRHIAQLILGAGIIVFIFALMIYLLID